MSLSKSVTLRYAFNDLRSNKGVNGALLVMLILSAFLMATGAMVMERTVGSVDRLFAQAQPPHFLQMHKGDYDRDALDRFAAEQPEIREWLVEEMLGYDGAAISWDRPSTGESGDLAESLIDNLFVTQNEEFDYLVDGAGAVPQPTVGEVYVPVAYQQSFDLRIGDELGIRTDEGVLDLHIAGFVRDAQMASSLSSATRFLVSAADFDELGVAGGGSPEIIVEYLLTDPGAASDLQRAYESDETVPKNGQAVTAQMIRMINAFSDGLVALALVFVSLLLIAIALLSLRFVIRGTLEDEVREIGAMKAIGISHRSITRLYLAKYSIMTVLACLLGGVLAIFAANVLTRGIQANYAQAPLGVTTFLVPVLALALVYLVVLVICRGVLRKVRRIEVVGALVHGSTLDERQTARRAKRETRRVGRTSLVAWGDTAGTGSRAEQGGEDLAGTGSRAEQGGEDLAGTGGGGRGGWVGRVSGGGLGGGVNRRLALLDLRAEAGQWALVPVVFLLAIVLMTLPMNLLSTFTSPAFVTYMGAPESDLRVDLQFSDDVDEVRAEVLERMNGDDRLSDIRAFATVLAQTQGEEGWEVLRVEVGDYAADTVEFVDGESPASGQIALSVLNADKYGLKAGDALTIRRDDAPTSLVVSGIYQDVTSGGYTAKMQGQVTTGASGYVIYANAAAGSDAGDVATDYSENFPTAAIIPMREYVQQTLSYVTDAFRSATVLAFIFGIGVAVLITSLFLRLLLTRERTKMGALSAIGFSMGEIIGQVRFRAVIAIVMGTVLGVVFAATVGESLVGGLISLAGLGIADLAFIPRPLIVFVAYPLLLIGAGYLCAVLLTARLRGAHTSMWIRG